MERKISEVFEFKGKTFRVKEDKDNSCRGCAFNNRCTTSVKAMAGKCAHDSRVDNKNVVFVEVQDQPQELTEQPQEQSEQPQGLNLCEILKNCPEGKTLWSPMLGDVNLYDLNEEEKNIKVLTKSGISWNINHDGTTTINGVTSPEIMLYPSREQRDWTKVKYEPKMERFDPKTLKAFDKVLVRGESILDWNCSLWSNINDFSSKYPFSCLGTCYKFCIPYNDDTKHLVGTKDEAPVFYRYWED